jgi:hypothetical protein
MRRLWEYQQTLSEVVSGGRMSGFVAEGASGSPTGSRVATQPWRSIGTQWGGVEDPHRPVLMVAVDLDLDADGVFGPDRAEDGGGGVAEFVVHDAPSFAVEDGPGDAVRQCPGGDGATDQIVRCGHPHHQDWGDRLQAVGSPGQAVGGPGHAAVVGRASGVHRERVRDEDLQA